MRTGRIETFARLHKFDGIKHYFRVRAANGKIIAQSEGYTTKRARDKGIRALVEACVAARWDGMW